MLYYKKMPVKTKKVCKTVVVPPKSRSARVVNPRNGKVKKNANGTEQRSFAIVSVEGKDVSRGSMYGADAMATAKKLFSGWCRDHKKTTTPKMRMVIREATRGGLGKEYKYVVSRQKLSTPKVLGKYEVKYEIQCKSAK